jgi:hypothetical protein
MGFYRVPQPASLNRADVTAIVTRFVAEEVAFAQRTQDPFGVADPCPRNAGGPHQFTGSCGDVVCLLCEKIVWS